MDFLYLTNLLQYYSLYSPWSSPGQDTGLGSLSPLQRIFPTRELNQALPHCRQILYQLSHKGSARTLEWATHPSPAELSGFSRHLVLSKKTHGDMVHTKRSLIVLSKTTWHGLDVLMYFLDRAQFQLPFDLMWTELFIDQVAHGPNVLCIFWARPNGLQSKAIPNLLVIPWMKQAKYTLFSFDFFFFFLT